MPMVLALMTWVDLRLRGNTSIDRLGARVKRPSGCEHARAVELVIGPGPTPGTIMPWASSEARRAFRVS